jgi:D-serine deaminase-like pyridoxal phosphate-dependent protein
MKKSEIPTPSLVVDYDKLQKNIAEMAARARMCGMQLRPHTKTHKTPIIAHMQIKAGAAGIACAKLGEAEVMAAGGIEDIFVAYPIVGEDKVERLLNLAAWTPKISTCVDSYPAIAALDQAAQARGQRMDVMVEVEAGYRRTGIEPGEPLLAFVRQIVTSCPGLRYKGLMYMAGGTGLDPEPEKQRAAELAGARIATEAAALLKVHGIDSEVISGGSTPGAVFMAELEGVNEYRPGCYVFGDMKYADLGAHTRQSMALTILASVVSVPGAVEPDHFVLDAGSKTLTHSGALTTPGYGTLVKYPALNVTVASEEHGAVHLPPGTRPPAIGEKLEIYPNYVSDVVNLSDRLWVVQGEQVIATWEIQARGKRV